MNKNKTGLNTLINNIVDLSGAKCYDSQIDKIWMRNQL